MIHIPVLKKEVIEYLNPKENENFIDCTVGQGGHSFAILEKNRPQGKVLGIDKEEELIKELSQKIKSLELEKRFLIYCGDYVELKEIVKKLNFFPVHGILFDFGMSSWHLEYSKRGFSFKKDEPLLMNYGIKSRLTAIDILNRYPEKEIERILREYGQEKFSRRIAKEIVLNRKKRKILTTFQLIEIIKKSVPNWYLHQKRHFATKSFQALRIAVNDELNKIAMVLPVAFEILEPKGRIVTISFHSLEDKIVKNFFKKLEKEKKAIILTKKPIKPTLQEVKTNPKSRSAKLRAVIKL
jgi:16S rRNA (cytosine1402-N4)-methyltransferase